jgi:hypothetical protein
VGLVGSGWVGRLLDGNSDNRANSAQVKMNLPTRAELGNKASKNQENGQSRNINNFQNVHSEDRKLTPLKNSTLHPGNSQII